MIGCRLILVPLGERGSRKVTTTCSVGLSLCPPRCLYHRPSLVSKLRCRFRTSFLSLLGPFFLRPSNWGYSPLNSTYLAWIQFLNIHLNRINTSRAAWPAYILHLATAPFTTKHRLLLSYLALSSIHILFCIVHCIIPQSTTHHHARQVTKETVSDSHKDMVMLPR